MVIKELISIIIPIYKVENYLVKCIESAINQSYKNIEIILINDASPDSCIDICNRYKNIDPRIIIINKINNEGVSEARNSGIDLCKGAYITFIDGDDYISESFIEILYYGIKKENAQIAQGNIKKTYINTGNRNQYNNGVKNFFNITPFDSVKKMYNKNGEIAMQYVLITGKLFNKKLFENLRFPKNKSHEDEFLNYKLYYLAENIIYIKIDLYFYMYRSDSFCHTKYTLDKISKLEALEGRCKFFRNIDSKELYNYSIYAFFCQILFNIYAIKKYFPEETKLILQLNKKLKNVKDEINKTSSLSIKYKVIVNIYFKFKDIFKYRNYNSI